MKNVLMMILAASVALAQTRQVDLSWSSTATAPTGVTLTHEIERAPATPTTNCTTATGYARIGSVPLSTRTYTDDAPLGTYCYRVSTLATAGTATARSTYAHSAVVVVPLAPPPGPSDLTGTVRELVAAVTLELDGKQVARTIVPIRVKAE